MTKEMMEELKKFSDLYCTGCSYCLPCPKGINIPYVFNCNTYKNVYGLDSVAQNMYSKLTGEEVKSASIDECVSCGKCKTKCPQHIDIPLKLKEVKDSFEK